MKRNQQLKIIEQRGPEEIISLLQAYISEARKKRIETVLEHRLMSIQLAIECPADIHNALAAIRSCEIFGVTTIHIITPEISIPSGKMISKGAIKWVEIIFYENIDLFFNEMKSQQIQIAGALPQGKEQLSDLPIHESLCLLFGNENRGLSPKAQQGCQWHYQIPMVGMTASLNLSVAAAISLFDATQRKRNFLQTEGDLTATAKKVLQARYYLNSVDPRLVRGLFYDI